MNETTDHRYRSIMERLSVMRLANDLASKVAKEMTSAVDMMAAGGLNPMAVSALRQMHVLLAQGFKNIEELIGLAEKLIADNMALRRDVESRTRSTKDAS